MRVVKRSGGERRERKGIRPKESGFTVTELAITMGILSILIGLGAASFDRLMGKYRAESEIRTFHADLLQARFFAMQKNKVHFFEVKSGPPSTYQLYEDTNESGGSSPDEGDTALWQSPKLLDCAPAWYGTLILDPRGVVKTDASSLTSNLSIAFNVGPADPEYDCLQVNAMRIKLGRKNGKTCEPR